jgi:hypothetical protein
MGELSTRQLSKHQELVIPNAPAQVGGRGILRQFALWLRVTGLRTGECSGRFPSLHTPLPIHERRKVPLSRKRAFGMTRCF